MKYLVEQNGAFDIRENLTNTETCILCDEILTFATARLGFKDDSDSLFGDAETEAFFGFFKEYLASPDLSGGAEYLASRSDSCLKLRFDNFDSFASIGIYFHTDPIKIKRIWFCFGGDEMPQSAYQFPEVLRPYLGKPTYYMEKEAGEEKAEAVGLSPLPVTSPIGLAKFQIKEVETTLRSIENDIRLAVNKLERLWKDLLTKKTAARDACANEHIEDCVEAYRNLLKEALLRTKW